MPSGQLTHVEIVLYALHKLGEHQRNMHTEDIAYQAYKLSGGRYRQIRIQSPAQFLADHPDLRES